MESLAIAIVYIATAQPGFLIAIPPGNVTVVWPPSGIALAAVLLLGYRAAAGVWLGSFLVNLLFFVLHQVLLTTGVTAASGIATGSMLQAVAGGFPVSTHARHADTAWAQRCIQLHGHLGLELLGRCHRWVE